MHISASFTAASIWIIVFCCVCKLSPQSLCEINSLDNTWDKSEQRVVFLYVNINTHKLMTACSEQNF